MPFQSEKQRRYLHANHPEIAKRWEKEYSHGGILDIDASEEIISDDGNDIELTDYNAAFDEPTGVKTLFQAKDGGTPQLAKKSKDGKRPGYQGPHGDGGWSPGVSHSGAPASTGSDRGPRDDPDRFGPTKDTTPSDGGMGAKETYIQTQYTSPEAIANKNRRDIREDIRRREEEKYDTEEQMLQDKYAFNIPGATKKHTYIIDKTNAAYQKALADQKAKLKSMGLGKLGKLGIMLVGFLAMGVPLGDALQYLPKTISLSKKDLGGLLSASIPVMKAKNAHKTALENAKADYEELGMASHHHAVDTEIQTIDQELLDLTQRPDEEDTKGDGPELPEVPQVVSIGGESEQYTQPEFDYWGFIKERQAQKKAYDEKMAQENLMLQQPGLAYGQQFFNKGGLANLFRVKNNQ